MYNGAYGLFQVQQKMTKDKIMPEKKLCALNNPERQRALTMCQLICSSQKEVERQKSLIYLQGDWLEKWKSYQLWKTLNRVVNGLQLQGSNVF